MVVLLAGCGTREPNQAFVAAGVDSGTTAGGGAAATTASGPAGSAAPAQVANGGLGAPVGAASAGPTDQPGAPPASGGVPGTVATAGTSGSVPLAVGPTGKAATPGSGAASAAPGAKTVTGGTANPKASATTGQKATTSATANAASDRGVTATSIKVCNIVTQGGALGAYEFTPNYYGAEAYFAALNAAGGINGRQVNYVSHPDDGSTSGNSTEVHACIDSENAFAFVANNVYQYGGASYVNSMDVPDIGGEPISTAYYQYPHLYNIEGDLTPRNGTSPGTNMMQYKSDEIGRFFKGKGITHVGVVSYDVSGNGGAGTYKFFQTQGIAFTAYQVNLGLPNFASTVAQMQSDGVDLVADALDLNGNQKLCQAIEQNSGFLAQMKVRLSTVSSWSNRYAQSLAGTPNCLGKTYVYAQTANFADASNPEVAKFQAAMSRYFPAQVPYEHEWMLEGYAAAEWFSDAAKSCGANLTRVCVEAFMNRNAIYTANGLLDSASSTFTPAPASYPGSTVTGCASVAHWNGKLWATDADITKSCGPATGYSYAIDPPT